MCWLHESLCKVERNSLLHLWGPCFASSIASVEGRRKINRFFISDLLSLAGGLLKNSEQENHGNKKSQLFSKRGEWLDTYILSVWTTSSRFGGGGGSLILREAYIVAMLTSQTQKDSLIGSQFFPLETWNHKKTVLTNKKNEKNPTHDSVIAQSRSRQ